MAAVLALGLLGSGPLLASDSLDQTARDVARQTGGKVLSARTLNLREGRTHEIKVLTGEGRVRTLRVPAEPSRNQRRGRDSRFQDQFDRRTQPRDMPRNLERNRAEDPNRYQDPRARQTYRQLFRDQNVQRAPRPADRRGQGSNRNARGERPPVQGRDSESRRARDNDNPERYR